MIKTICATLVLLCSSFNYQWDFEYTNKDEFVLVILSAPIIVLAYAVFSDDPAMMQKIELFFHHFGNLPVWFQTLWITVVASIFGIKGTQIFRNGKK